MRMQLAIQDDEASFETKILLVNFPHLVEQYMQNYGDTRQLETIGQDLLAHDFPVDELSQFIRKVCFWGGYSGTAGRVFNRNSLIDIKQQFVKAVNAIDQEKPDIKAALQEINMIKGLGTLFFFVKAFTIPLSRNMPCSR